MLLETGDEALDPLRSLVDTGTKWAKLIPLVPYYRNVPPLHHGARSKPLILLPSHGGRTKKKSHLSLAIDPPPSGTFTMGRGPSDSGYWQRPEHMRTNRTKNKNPNRVKCRGISCDRSPSQLLQTYLTPYCRRACRQCSRNFQMAEARVRLQHRTVHAAAAKEVSAPAIPNAYIEHAISCRYNNSRR